MDPMKDFENLEPRCYPAAGTPPIPIGGAYYRLREADMPTEDKYRAASMRGVGLTINEETGTKKVEIPRYNAGDASYILVSGCLYKCSKEGEYEHRDKENNQPQPVGEVFLRAAAWPSRVRKFLFDKAKEISELDDDNKTPETIRKEITKLQEKLAKLEADTEGK